MSSIKIRYRKLGDIPTIISLIRHGGFPMWYRRLPLLLLPTLMAVDGDQVVGFMILPWKIDKDGAAELQLVAVAEGHRRRGIAQALVLASMEELTRRGAKLCTGKLRIEHIAVQRMYAKLGFRTVGVKHRRFLGDMYLIEHPLPYVHPDDSMADADQQQNDISNQN